MEGLDDPFFDGIDAEALCKELDEQTRQEAYRAQELNWTKENDKNTHS